MTKALFFDIDGTLLDRRHSVSYIPENAQRELLRVRDEGNLLFVCSGRPKMLLSSDVECIPWDGYVLANGGYVEIGGEVVYVELMGLELATRAADLLESLGFEYTINTARHTYVPRSYTTMINYFGIRIDTDKFTFDFDRQDALGRAIKLETFPLKEEREHIRQEAARQIGPAVAFNDNGTRGTFELYSSRLSKINGIKMVLEKFGIAQEDSYGFGDGTNDIGMIRYCGTGVAMGNAQDEVKQAADIVCGSVDEDGLARILRELFPV